MVSQLIMIIALNLFICEICANTKSNLKTGYDTILNDIYKNNKRNDYKYIIGEIDESTLNNLKFIDENTIAITDNDNLHDSHFKNYVETGKKINNTIYNYNKPLDMGCYKTIIDFYYFYLGHCVNSRMQFLQNIENIIYRSEYYYTDGELALFECQQDRFSIAYLAYYEMRDSKLMKIISIKGTDGQPFVNAYIRLESTNLPFKFECLYVTNNTRTHYSIFYLFRQEKNDNPSFIVNGVVLPIMAGYIDINGPFNNYLPLNFSEYFNYVNEDLNISITKSYKYDSASCNLIKYPMKELNKVECNNDTISLKSLTSRSFTLFCELHGPEAEPYNMTLYSESMKYNHVPLLNRDPKKDVYKFENFTNTEPCLYGLYWSNTLAKYYVANNHVHVKYQYEVQQEYIRIVCVSRFELIVHYNKTEVKLEKSPEVIIIKWDNNTIYNAIEFKIVLYKEYNMSTITFEGSGKYTVELVNTEVKKETEKMTILKRNSLDEILDVQNYGDLLRYLEPETATDNGDTVIIIISGVLIVVTIVLGLFGGMRVLRQKKIQKNSEPSVIYNQRQSTTSEHIYETINYDLINVQRTAPDISKRLPQPLPSEASEENQYDSPYDWIIGVPAQ